MTDIAPPQLSLAESFRRQWYYLPNWVTYLRIVTAALPAVLLVLAPQNAGMRGLERICIRCRRLNRWHRWLAGAPLQAHQQMGRLHRPDRRQAVGVHLAGGSLLGLLRWIQWLGAVGVYGPGYSTGGGAGVPDQPVAPRHHAANFPREVQDGASGGYGGAMVPANPSGDRRMDLGARRSVRGYRDGCRDYNQLVGRVLSALRRARSSSLPSTPLVSSVKLWPYPSGCGYLHI